MVIEFIIVEGKLKVKIKFGLTFGLNVARLGLDETAGYYCCPNCR